MIPGLDPKKMKAVMKQLGMSQEEINASQVIIKKTDNKSIIINNPSVAKIKIQGEETFQISGDISEEGDSGRNGEVGSEGDEEQIEQDIETIMQKTGIKDKDLIAIELEKNSMDLAKTILELSKK